MSNVEGPYDMENISLDLQGYNYGKGYLTWAIQHFGGYTRAYAKVYSDEQKTKYQIDVYGDPQYVFHVLRYYHLGNGDIDYSLVIAPVVAELCTTSVALSAPPNSYQNNSQS